MTLSWTCDKLGPMARGVEDTILVLNAISGFDPEDTASVNVPLSFNAGRNVAGLKVVAAHLTGYEQPIPAGVSGVVPIDYKRAGALLADWAIAKTDAKVNAVVIGINDVLSTESMMSGIKEEFAKCANCKMSYINVTIPEMATKTQTNVQAASAGGAGGIEATAASMPAPARASQRRCWLAQSCQLLSRARSSNAPWAPWSSRSSRGCHRLSGWRGSRGSSLCCAA